MPTAKPASPAAKKSPAARKAPARPAPRKSAAAKAPVKAVAKAAPTKAAPSSKAAAAAPAGKPAKHKLVRDSFSMPQQDFDLIATLKKRAIGLGRPAKKSELLRAGLHALTKLGDRQLRAALESLIQLKTGRPRKTA